MTLLRQAALILVAGTAPAAVQAQAPAPDQPGPASGAADPAPSPPPRIEVRGPDGKPLPPEVQRQLLERYKDQLTPGLTGGAPSGASAGADPDDREIVVSVEKPRGSVVGDIPPELTFNPADIRAYGANDVSELLQNLGAQVGSDRGRDEQGPVVLLNGRRVSGLAEIARIPAEAIERMEVFPEELALRYGYPANQKVVNIVVFERYSAKVAQLSYAAATEGGRDTPGASANWLRIRGDTRLHLDAEYNRSGALLESERGLLQVAGPAELGRFRTLLPKNERFVVNGTVSADVIENVSSTLNGRFESNRSFNLFGLGATGPLTGLADADTAHLGTTLGGRIGTWQWTFTGNYDRTRIETRIDGPGPVAAVNVARSVDSVANADLVMSGDLLQLPAGPVSLSLRGGVDLRDFESRSTFAGLPQRVALARDRGVIQANMDLPIASRKKDSLAFLGDLSINGNVLIEDLSDFGTLRTIGYGLNWTPNQAINLVASVTHEEGAPALEQLGGPLIVTPNVRTFDFGRRETVDVTRLFGGNPELRDDDRHVLSVGLTLKPLAKTDFTISLDYLRTRVDDPIAAFPIVTPALEAGFPERFTRAPSGQLLRIDARPLNFSRSSQQQLRFGLNFTRPLGEVPPELRDVRVRFAPSEADMKRRLPPGATITRLDPASSAARQAQNLTSRLFVSLYYTLRLEDEILLREGGPTLDLLDGDAVDFRGGRPRHEIEFQAGAFKRGLGIRLSATWTSGTTVSGLATASGGAGDLRFSDFGTVNLTMFANLADRFGGPDAPGWLKKTRISLNVLNLFNDRPQVRDSLGATPINYQPAYLNPIGRVVSLTLRKAF